MAVNKYGLLQAAQQNGARLRDNNHVDYASAMGRGYGFGNPPGGLYDDDSFTPETAAGDPRKAEFRQRDASTPHAVRSIHALLALDADVHAANGDRTLSPAGKSERLAAVVPARLQTIAKTGAALAAQAPDLDAQDADIYKVAPAGNDFEQVMHDRELRDDFRGRPVGEREQILGRITDGKEPRMLLALKRSPVPLDPRHAQTIDTAWRAGVDRAQPEKSAALKTARAAHSWATDTVHSAARYAASASGLPPHMIAKALGDTDTAGVFGTQGAAASGSEAA